ncbi:hypothetical protein DNK47_03125 [Mycoplasma wenyonii]|uniref:Restriction endonuclease type II NgoFVII C-terminal B3-like DNA-binding domain-containing protein n=1 Tax=Mycoplasma wenyonii TaxID=65123 RepID=A0A328PJY6_9MOLU|nr:restriction endonuclease PLD domain-containing protein [Mycoplasma wenyonii]RAO94794.1 hypothetical protein DNK47_03125 [Mycoplasma wenyonii]
MLTLKEVESAEFSQTIVFPLIVPSCQEILYSSTHLDLSKSALNACYNKPLFNEKTGKEQSWYDVQLTVDGQYDLPPKEEWFYIVCDDGFIFKGRFAGKKIRRLSTFEDKRIIGLWIKGRLAECGFVPSYDFVCYDRRRDGIIYKEILESYGGDKVFLKKTNKTKKDRKGIERDVWYISFPNDL